MSVSECRGIRRSAELDEMYSRNLSSLVPLDSSFPLCSEVGSVIFLLCCSFLLSLDIYSKWVNVVLYMAVVLAVERKTKGSVYIRFQRSLL